MTKKTRAAATAQENETIARANAKMNEGKIKEALEMLDGAFSSPMKCRRLLRQAAERAEAYENCKKSDMALEIYNAALEFSRRNGFRQGVGAFSTAIGNIYLRENKLDKARECYVNALSECKSLWPDKPLPRGCLTAARGLAKTFLETESADEVCDIFCRVLESAPPDFVKIILQRINFLGHAYESSGWMSGAQKIYELSYKKSSELAANFSKEHELDVAVALRHLMDVYFKIKDFDRAISSGMKSLRLRRKWDNGSHWIATLRKRLSEICKARKDRLAEIADFFGAPVEKKKKSCKKPSFFAIRRQTLGYGGMAECEYFEFVFPTKELARAILDEITDSAGQIASHFSGDRYSVDAKPDGKIIVDAPKAEKNWYWQEYLIKTLDMESIVGLKLKFAVDENSIPAEVIEAWVTPKPARDDTKENAIPASSSGNWDKFSMEEWCDLLAAQPQFEGKFRRWEDFKKPLYSNELTCLLSNQPQFADKLDWSVISSHIYFSTLLQSQPQFAARCQQWEFDGNRWKSLLISQPQFSDKCQWGRLNEYDWEWLLERQPTFANKCKEIGMLSKLDLRSGDWVKILTVCPSLADAYSNWDDFDSGDWRKLISAQPQFIERCDVAKLSNKLGWGKILSAQPQLEKYCDFNKLSADALVELISAQPQFVERCDLSKLTSTYWALLLCEQPQLSKLCNMWEDFSAKDWVRLLRAQPEFSDKCDWQKIPGSREDIFSTCWADLLEAQPQFAKYCDKWNDFSVFDWGELLSVRPEFIEKCPLGKLQLYKDNIHNERRNPWVTILSRQPQLAGQCDWSLFSGLDRLNRSFVPQGEIYNWSERDVVMLLDAQPQLAKYFDWSKLKIDSLVWNEIVLRYPRAAGAFVVNMDNRTRRRLVDTTSWVMILKVSPELASIFESQENIRRS